MKIVVGGGDIGSGFGHDIIKGKDPLQSSLAYNKLGKVETLFITAGFLVNKRFISSEFSNISKAINGNLGFQIEFLHEVIDKIIKDGTQVVVFSSIGVTHSGIKGYSLYLPLKIALESFLLILKRETNIDIRIIRNGRTRTKMATKVPVDDSGWTLSIEEVVKEVNSF